VALTQMKTVDAQSIFNVITNVLHQLFKNWTSVISACFDGASTMSQCLVVLEAFKVNVK